MNFDKYKNNYAQVEDDFDHDPNDDSTRRHLKNYKDAMKRLNLDQTTDLHDEEKKLLQSHLKKPNSELFETELLENYMKEKEAVNDMGEGMNEDALSERMQMNNFGYGPQEGRVSPW
jgi:hypothetical protein